MFDEIAVRCEHTRLMDPNELRPHPQNPNKHPKNQIRMLVKSIKAFGWRHPIVISSRSGYIVAGHARQQAAIEMGCQVPVDVQDFDSDESELAVLLADNILQELSTLDTDLLEAHKEIILSAGYELEEIGIEIHDNEMIEGKSGLNGDNYSNVTGTRYPINLFGIGGFVPRETGDMVVSEFEKMGAVKGDDNSSLMTEWIERVFAISP